MKKIFFGKDSNADDRNAPIWKPWGLGGWLGRLIGFLLLLGALIVLLSLFHKCEREADDEAETAAQLADNQFPEDLISNPDFEPVPIDTGTGNIPGRISDPGPYLPDNPIRPIHDDDVIDDPDTRTQIDGTRINVILNSDAGDETFRRFAEEFKTLYPGDEYQVSYYNTFTKLMQLTVPANKREQVKSQLPEQITDIDFMVFDDTVFEGYARRTRNHPNDKIFEHPEYAWFYEPINAYEAWDMTMGSPDVTIAIVDSYFDLNHPDLNSDRIVKPYSVRFESTDVAPASDCPEIDPNPRAGGAIYAPFEHGTMVASQALGTANNTSAMCGIAPRCKFMPISVGHQFTSFSLMQGILYAINQGADVINISAGSVFSDDAKEIPLNEQINMANQFGLSEEEVWDYIFNLADQRNVTIVWAAGNDEVFSSLDSSKRGANTVRVAAVDRDLSPAWFTNFGNIAEHNIEESTVSAPGVDIFGARPYGKYDKGPGTSFAAPLVTGAVGLMKSVNPDLTNEEIVNILKTTGKPLGGRDSRIGPLLQIDKALEAARARRNE